MASYKSLYILLALTAVNLISAQEDPGANTNSDSPSRHETPQEERRPSFGFGCPVDFGSGFGFPLPFFDFNGVPDRRHEYPKHHRNFNNEPGSQDTLRNIVTCNHIITPGRTCISCNETLICSRLNLGIVSTCKGRRPHCNQGVCSTTPSEDCNSAFIE
ncbi:unnamed protein product [Parnassius mnemosyne]|uniref:Secreted protein n=1 Tax=Parnassius mnemosyne TaxID=213953 RepID=A0AAV1KV33_9NEOP